MNQYYDNQFQTNDLALAAALNECGFAIIELDASNPRRIAFVFDHTADLDDTTKKYWKGSLRVDPKSYFDNLRHLKSRLYTV